MAEFGMQIEKFTKNERSKIIVVSKKINPSKIVGKKISLDLNNPIAMNRSVVIRENQNHELFIIVPKSCFAN